MPFALAWRSQHRHPVRVSTQRESEPDGYQPPTIVYLVEFTDEAGDVTDGQAGAFTTEAEAVVVRDRLLAECRHGPVQINMVPVHARAADWEFDR